MSRLDAQAASRLWVTLPVATQNFLNRAAVDGKS